MLTETKKNLLLSLLGILLLSISTQAQNAWIVGPPELCVGECGQYTFMIDGLPGPFDEYEWDDGTGNTIFSTSPTETLCFNETGIYTINVTALNDSISASYSIFVSDGFIPEIVSATPTNCPDNGSTSSCEKVCANSTSSYTVLFNNGFDLDWTVQGADSYDINGDVITVNWGNPGAGHISVTSIGGTVGNDSLQLNCGSTLATVNFNDGTAWVDPFGGTPPYSYLWSDGQTAAFVSGLTVGTYCVEVYDANGQSASCCVVIGEQFCTTNEPIIYIPSINHASSCDDCDGSIDITMTGGFPPYTVLWSNGQTGGGLQDLCPGTYSVSIYDNADCYATADITIFCESSAICTGTADLCIDIIEDPEAIITSNPPVSATTGMIEICQGQTVFFGNESLNAESYEWSSGTGQMVSTQDASFTYPDGGIYEVQLVAKNECLCSDTTTVLVNVDFAEGPQIDCVGTICENETVTYTADANGCSTYNWTISANGTIVAGGGPNDDFITINWGAGPEGTIELSVTNCATAFCQMPTLVIVPIISDDAEIEGPSKVCRGDVATYSITKWNGTEYNWTVSNYGTIKSGQNSNEIVVKWDVSFIPPDQQWVSVDYENCYLECGGSDIHAVDILPEFFLTGPIEACQNSTTVYSAKDVVTNGFIIADWTLTAPDGSLVWTSTSSTSMANVLWPSTTGVYRLDAVPTVTADYCFDQASIFVKVVAAPPPPTGIDGPALVCPGEPFNYTVISDKPYNGFEWVINDGGTMTSAYGPSINIIWGNTPPYEVSVVEISTEGLPCVSLPTTFSSAPIVDLVISGDPDVCVEETILYSATFYEEVDYQWTITPEDAGTVIEGQNSESVEVMWHTDLVATIEVNMCGLVEQFPVNVYPLPEPQVNHPVGLCSGTTEMLSTTIPYVSYKWLNEDSVLISTAAAPNLPAGNWEIIVVDDNGCEGNGTFFIEEYLLPEIRISTPDNTAFCVGDPIPTIYALNTEDGYSYQWYRDNTPVGSNTVSLTTGDFGYYYLQVTDLNGCTNNSNVLELRDYCGPIGGGGSGTCTGGTCTLDPNCPQGFINFQINPTTDCPTSQFTNTTIDLLPGSSTWNFGDPGSGANNFSTDDNPSHTFTNAGFYVVVLHASTTTGVTCWYAKADTVPIVANFDAITGCAGEVTQFLGLTTFLPQPFAEVVSYSWDFDDPASGTNNTSTDEDPTHTYTVPGSYSVTLTSTNQDGCTSSRTKIVEVYEPPVISFPIPTFNCEGTPLEFNAVVPTNVVEVLWDFGDASSGEANTSISEVTFHAFEAPGSYNVTLTATNIYGCVNTYNNTVTIDPNPLNGLIDFTSPICEGVITTITAPSGGASWEWSNGETTESIQTSEAGIYGVTMTDAMGCIYIPASAPLDIIPAPDGSILVTEFNEFGQPVSNFFEDYSTCEGEDVFVHIIGTGNYTYQWSNGIMGDQLAFDDVHLGLLTVGTHDFVVTITDVATGCTNEVGPFTVTINPLPTNVQITASPQPVCAPELTTFTVQNPQVDFTYLWSNGAIGTTMQTSIAGEYYVTAITPFGCEGESNIVEIFAAPDITLIPDGCHERCNPDTICLPNIPNIVSYQWYQDGSVIPAPEGTVANYVAVETGNYQVLLTDANGCTALSSGLILNLLPMDTMALSLDACTGETAEYVGDQLLPGSVTEYVFTNMEGCDSTVTVTVIERELYDINIPLEGCAGTMVSYNGIDYPVGTQPQLFYTSQYGCDSTITLLIDELPVYTTALTLEVCSNETVEYAGATLAPGDTYEVTLTSSQNCDSVVTVTVDPYPTFSFALEASDPVCWNNDNGSIVVKDLLGGTAPFVYSTDGDTYLTTDSLTALAGGQHTIYVQDDNGCVEELEAEIGLIEPIEMLLAEVVLNCSDDSVQIKPILVNNYADEVTWTWQDGTNEKVFPAFDPGQYGLLLENVCEVKQEIIDVALQPDGREEFFFMPNVFSPNQDGNNDYFTGLHSGEIMVIDWELSIFDRWGTTLYQSSDINEGWDGYFNDEALNPGVYIWMYKATIQTCHRKVVLSNHGDVTVLR